MGHVKMDLELLGQKTSKASYYLDGIGILLRMYGEQEKADMVEEIIDTLNNKVIRALNE